MDYIFFPLISEWDWNCKE